MLYREHIFLLELKEVLFFSNCYCYDLHLKVTYLSIKNIMVLFELGEKVFAIWRQKDSNNLVLVYMIIIKKVAQEVEICFKVSVLISLLISNRDWATYCRMISIRTVLLIFLSCLSHAITTVIKVLQLA